MREDLGKLVLRVAVGALLLFHGVSKLRHGIDSIITSTHAHGLPTAFAYGVFAGELVAPLFLLAGFGTRIAAVVVALNMVVAVWFVHPASVFSLGRAGGWALELPALYFAGAVVVALLGPGRFSASKGRGRFA